MPCTSMKEIPLRPEEVACLLRTLGRPHRHESWSLGIWQAAAQSRGFKSTLRAAVGPTEYLRALSGPHCFLWWLGIHQAHSFLRAFALTALGPGYLLVQGLPLDVGVPQRNLVCPGCHCRRWWPSRALQMTSEQRRMNWPEGTKGGLGCSFNFMYLNFLF